MSVWRGLFFVLAAGAMGGAALTPPAVTVQAVPQSGRLQTRGGFGRPFTIDPLPVVIVVSNASDRELRDVELVLPPNSDVSFNGPSALAASVAPYGAFLGHITLQPKPGLVYGRHDFLLGIRYRWKTQAAEVTSIRTATVAAEVKRPFEEEVKGLPGGTAALFWLLLPVFPAFFAYELVDRWRRGEGFQVPTFGSEFLLPAFFIGLLVSSLGLDSRASVLAAAAVVGALWPAMHWVWDAWQRYRWEFKESDDDRQYLRKALLAPRAPRRFRWATGEIDGQPWEGVRLTQPGGRPVLGSELQLIIKDADRATVAALVDAITGDEWRRDRRTLYGKVKRGELDLKRKRTVQPLNVIATDDLAGFALKNVEETKLLELTN